MAVYLARDCPMCRNYFGVVIARPNGSGYRPVHGRCATCGYEIAWALISLESLALIMSKVKDKERSAISADRLQFVEPMYARAVQQLPQGIDWVYEVKF